MAYWLKLGYFKEARSDPEFWKARSWVSDSPGRVSPHWTKRPRPRSTQRYPPFGPRYELGDRLVMYLTEINRCPAILEVVEAPQWAPDTVDAEDPQAREGDRWGVVTRVECVAATDRDVDLGDFDVARSSIARKGHVRLSEAQYAEAERLIAGKRAGVKNRANPELIAIEAGEIEGYDVTTPAAVKRALRRESRLVREYADRLGGDAISRHKIPPGTGQRPIYSDVFNQTRNQLIEAKAHSDRSSIRMAIGQLLDYSRFVRPKPALAVLLEAKPAPDLVRLLKSQDIAVIWRHGDGFKDNAKGRFV